MIRPLELLPEGNPLPDYAPLSRKRNPCNPDFVEPSDLIIIPVAGRTGRDRLLAKVTEYEQKLGAGDSF